MKRLPIPCFFRGKPRGLAYVRCNRRKILLQGSHGWRPDLGNRFKLFYRARKLIATDRRYLLQTIFKGFIASRFPL